MPIPDNDLDRIDTGVLGEIISVYLGRPVENWGCERITSELGKIQNYVHNKLNKPLELPDDDMSGTFTFMHALQEDGNFSEIKPPQIGQSWPYELIEGLIIL